MNQQSKSKKTNLMLQIKLMQEFEKHTMYATQKPNLETNILVQY